MCQEQISWAVAMNTELLEGVWLVDKAEWIRQPTNNY